MFIAGLLLFGGCQDKEPEVLEYEDIIAGSDRDGSGDDQDVTESGDSLAFLRNGLQEAGIGADWIGGSTAMLFPDRFGPETTRKYLLAAGTDTLSYYTWVYSDSMRVMNALYNWIDCFGDKCKSVYLGENANMQRNPFQLWVSDSTLVFIEAREKMDYTVWEKYLESQGYPKEWNYVIEQGKGGKARWFVYEDEKKKTFKK